MKLHGTVIKVGKGEREHHNDGEECIEVVGDRADEQLKAVHAAARSKPGNGGCPRGDRRDNADRSGSCVDEIGELRAGNALCVSNRAHNAADR